MGDAIPAVNMANIEGLGWATKKKIKDDQICVVTKFSFEAESSADALHTLHNLLKNGGPLTVTFRSPGLQMELDLQHIQETKEGGS